MNIPTVALAMLLLSQQPADAPKIPATVLKAGLGPCSADFTVNDASGAPIYAATVHVKIRYGIWNIKRADLEVGTNSDGKARIEGLPEKARLLHYDVHSGDKTSTVEQDLTAQCHAEYTVTLK